MKNRASAKEEKEKEKGNITSHRGLTLGCRSLWFIIFTGIILLQQGEVWPAEKSLFSQGDTSRIVLDNGMVVLLKEDHNLPLVDFFLCVRSGSAQEGNFAGSGISHFIEHMVFKGTKTRLAGDIFKEIESFGGKINASTSYDYTCYKVTVPSEFAHPALEILADMVINATFPEDELEKEREVVLKEIRLNYDNPQRRISRLLWQTAYSVHPYKYSILGEEHIFKSLTREDLIKFYHDNYTPENMVLAVVGELTVDATLSAVKELFRDFQRKPSINLEVVTEPNQLQVRKYQEEFTTGLTYLLLGFHSVSIKDEDCFALDVLGTILGEGENSRLYQTICDKGGLAYSIEAINYTPRHPGLFIISGFLEERYRKRVLSLVLKQIKMLKKKAVAQDELESAKAKIISDILFYNQTLEAQAQDLALNEALADDFRFTEEYIQKINQVSSSDVLEVAKQYLSENNLSIVALIPKDKPSSCTTSELGKSKKLDSLKKPSGKLNIGIENLATKELKTSEVNKYVLDNGLVLLVREKKDLPLVSIKAVLIGGLRAETKDINGLSNLVAQMLDKGTKSKTASEIANLVESRGGRISCFSGNNSFGLSLDLLSKDLDSMLALLADLIINSTFPQRELARQKEKNLAELNALEDNIFETGTKLLKATLFQKHPYRFLGIGNEKSLKMLRRRDLINFYRKFCVPKNMVLAVFGDVNAQDVLTRVKKLFAEFESSDRPCILPVEEPKIKGMQTSFKLLAKQQSLVIFGFPGTRVFDKDRFTIELICQILSQSSGRLFSQIRETSGLAYTLGAYSVIGLDPGYIAIYVATTGENVKTVKEEVLQQLRLLKQNPLTETELAQAKRALLAQKLIGRQTNSSCALESSLDELYGLGHNYYLNYSEQIKELSASDITRSANQYFNLDNYAIVVVGPHNIEEK